MRRNLLHDEVNRLLQLRVVSGEDLTGQVVNLDVGRHSTVLDQPLAVESVERELGRGHIAAVDQRNVAANAAYTSPGALANQRTEFVHLEKVAEEITVGGGIVVGDASHVSIEDVVRLGVGRPIAGRSHAGEHAPQPLEDKLVDEASSVVTDIEDHALLADLREILLHEFVQPLGSHVGQVDVTDASATQLLHFAAVGLDPIQLMQSEVALYGTHDNVVCSLC